MAMRFFKRVLTTRLIFDAASPEQSKTQPQRKKEGDGKDKNKEIKTGQKNEGQKSQGQAKLASRPRYWFCGHCKDGPMSFALDTYCESCGRLRDVYARY